MLIKGSQTICAFLVCSNTSNSNPAGVVDVEGGCACVVNTFVLDALSFNPTCPRQVTSASSMLPTTCADSLNNNMSSAQRRSNKCDIPLPKLRPIFFIFFSRLFAAIRSQGAVLQVSFQALGLFLYWPVSRCAKSKGKVQTQSPLFNSTSPTAHSQLQHGTEQPWTSDTPLSHASTNIKFVIFIIVAHNLAFLVRICHL